MVVVSFLQVLKDGGFSQVIISGEDEKIADSVFSIQMVVGLVAVLLLFLGSPAISQFYQNEEVIMPLQVIAVTLLISPFIDIPTLLCQRKLDFKANFFRNAIAPISSGLVSITLAIQGFGYWALVIGMIVGQVFSAVFLIWLTKWRPRVDFSLFQKRDDMEFGIHMLYQGILRWSKNSVAKLTLAKSNGMSGAGVL